ncbi:hypothetical protein [Moraxella lacunata]|uniref:hypothetical protein n=1 Tax=Moraxella lacunata TaxID=477 RepID=UPI003EE1A31B
MQIGTLVNGAVLVMVGFMVITNFARICIGMFRVKGLNGHGVLDKDWLRINLADGH